MIACRYQHNIAATMLPLLVLFTPTLLAAHDKYTPCNDFLHHTCYDMSFDRKMVLHQYSKEDYKPMRFTSSKQAVENQRPAFELLSPGVVYKWVNQFITTYTAKGFVERTKIEETMKDLPLEEQAQFAREQLGKINVTETRAFENGLDAAIKMLRIVNQTDTQKNKHHMHYMFRRMKVTLNKTIKTKRAYETKLFELWSAIEESEDIDFLEKMVRIGALEHSVKVLSNFTKHSDRFMYQSTLSYTGYFGYNYEKEIFISYRMIEASRHAESSLNWGDLGFILGHELIHSIFGNHPVPFENRKRQEQMNCVLDYMTSHGKTRNTTQTHQGKPNFWNAAKSWKEDIANIEGLRISYDAYRTAHHRSDEELRVFLHSVALRHCVIWKNRHRLWEFDGNHSPLIMADSFLAQLPDFQRLFQCKPKDRLYMEPSQYCSVIGLLDRPPTLHQDHTQRIHRHHTSLGTDTKTGCIMALLILLCIFI